MNSVMWPFLLALVLWGAVRVFTWPLPEWVRRGFWGVLILLVGIPMFLSGSAHNPFNMQVLSLCAGAGGAEWLITTLYHRWERFQARQAAAKQAAEAAHAQAKAERRERRRQRRQARQDEDT